MLGLKVAGFMGTIIAMPIVGLLDADTAIEKMGKGSTQVVLSIVAVFLAIGIIKQYMLHRRDLKEQQVKSDKLLTENSARMAENSTALKEFKEAVYHLADVTKEHTIREHEK